MYLTLVILMRQQHHSYCLINFKTALDYVQKLETETNILFVHMLIIIAH